MLQTPPSPTLPVEVFQSYEAVARVEVDRYCGACGYNLLSQPVRIDSRLALPLVRCPECGRYEWAHDPAAGARQWWRRLAVLAFVLWILLLLGGQAVMLSMQAGMTAATIDELTTWGHAPDGDQRFAEHDLTLFVERDTPADFWVPRVLTVILFVSSFAWIALGSAVFPHWRRRALAAWAILWPAPVAIVLYLIVSMDGPLIRPWLATISAQFAFAASAGGLIAAFVGRTTIRWLIRALLPPRLREPFAYLWTVDGLTPHTLVADGRPMA